MNELAREARKRLIDRRRTIVQLSRQEESGEVQLQDGAIPDPLDDAAVHAPLKVLERLRGAQRQEMQELEAALERIDHGTYGTCEICGGAVGRQRLRAIPEARYCIDCVATRRAPVAR